MSINHNESGILLLKDKIRENELFRDSNISDSALDKLDFRIIDLESGEVLFREDDPANSIYLIVEGEINLIKKQNVRKTQVLLTKNNFFSHEEYFLQTNRDSIAISLTDSQIVELSKENVKAIFPHSPVLNNIRDSIIALNYKSIEKFKVTDELTDRPEKKFNSSDGTKNKQQKKSVSASKNESETPMANTVDYKKINLDEIESGINRFISNINENLSLIEKEKNKMRSTVLRLEDQNRELFEEIEELKEKKDKLFRLDREKNEILGWQSYRIIELEREEVKFKNLESEYSNKIETLVAQETKNIANIERLKIELQEKGKIVSKLGNDLKENKKTISDFGETRLGLLQEIENRVHFIETQEEKIENLKDELSKKDLQLKELKEDISNKNNIISAQNDIQNKINAQIAELSNTLDKKNEEIEGLSSKLAESQNQISNQSEREKSKDEFILNQSHNIAEYEEKLKSLEKESFQKEETIEKFINDIGDFARSVWHKQNEINELKKSSEEFYNRETKLQQEISNLQSQLAEVNNKLSEDVKEKVVALQLKEKENTELNAQVLEIQQQLNELKEVLQSKDDHVIDLENVIKQLKNGLENQPELQKLKDDLNGLTNRLSQRDIENFELNNEKNKLIHRIIELKQIVKGNNNDSNNNLSKLEGELDAIKLEMEKYKNIADEKNKIINRQKEQLENLETVKSEEIKTLMATKKSYQEDIKSKNKQISDINNELEEIKKTLDEKKIIEEQLNETIENQAQIIAGLNDLANEFKAKDEHKITEGHESILSTDSENDELSTEANPDDCEEILSKSKFISAASSNSSDDRSFECFEYSGVYIVNINLSIATLEVVSPFSKFLLEIINANMIKLIVNLSSCEFIDSSFLGALVNSLKKVAALGGDLRIVSANQDENSMLHITSLDKVFQIFDNLKDAVESYS